MTKVDYSKLSVREMKEDESEIVLEILKDGFRDTENRLILYILTRPLALLILAVVSSGLRFILNSFILALLVPVLLAIVVLKFILWRSPDLKQLYSHYSSSGRKIWVAVYDHEDICGCVALEPMNDGETVQLKRMSVIRWYRRCGVGRVLLEFFECHARLRGFQRVVLYTSVVSKAAVAFYKSCGYTETDGMHWLGYTVAHKFSKDL
ncbi:probable N-acetyltransferase 14 [Latimeria chalumnae]|uniref:Probable N-acetyltransferase 14 n=1 Tax=Latimeria chalumnae TaxID=7897 RepID=H3AZH2_LATCH|nr:PREDICTED: N-acetyltransferase 14 [Latimeria chalumnae]XP_005990464.1 PREDICTED: N-acetyltransferase 14 [Latimeria chalumnae]XP_005990465.1 PREDICTED: N-acetyltransferase 14 [Latimeria chalumnae]|eukprot:XP_005990463.1 PREDICTED: N-acetyltransferase 14 [Latimeria chalumnae]